MTDYLKPGIKHWLTAVSLLLPQSSRSPRRYYWAGDIIPPLIARVSPFSPNNATIKSEKPLITLGWSVNSGCSLPSRDFHHTLHLFPNPLISPFRLESNACQPDVQPHNLCSMVMSLPNLPVMLGNCQHGLVRGQRDIPRFPVRTERYIIRHGLRWRKQFNALLLEF